MKQQRDFLTPRMRFQSDLKSAIGSFLGMRKAVSNLEELSRASASLYPEEPCLAASAAAQDLKENFGSNTLKNSELYQTINNGSSNKNVGV